MGILPTPAQGMRGAMKMAFDTWAKNNAKYSALYKSLDKRVLEIGYTAFDEMTIMKPTGYEIWWATNHNRFVRDVMQRQLQLLHEIIYYFLSAYARGELKKEDGRAATVVERQNKKAKA